MNVVSDYYYESLERPQVFNFEIVIDQIRIIKGDHRNYIPVGEKDSVLKVVSRNLADLVNHQLSYQD